MTINGYDNTIYVIGKGPSATTLDPIVKSIPEGSSVMITGTVTDQSPGAKGTPAIADWNMSSWMEYLYFQREFPSNIQGVEVTLSATAPDGTVTTIGKPYSTASGVFGFQWTPPGRGTYKIAAVFPGSESYAASYAETYIGVDAVASTETGVTSDTINNTVMTDVIIAAVAIILAIAIVGILILRKK